MVSHRLQKFSALLKKELSFLIEQDFSESLGMISIPDIQVSPDLKFAKVYLSFLNQGDEEKSLKKVNSKSYGYQKLLGRKLKMRNTPKLVFLLDTGQEKVDKIDSLLKEIDYES